MFIYKITNLINNKIYIGKTIGTLKQRWYNHVYCSQKNTKHTHKFHNAIRKYGKDNFKIEELFIINTLNELNEKEKIVIKEMRKLYGKENIYNVADGGNGGDALNAKDKTYKELYGEEEAKRLKKIRSISQTGVKFTEEHCKHLSESRKNKKHTEQQNLEKSIAYTGEGNPFYNKKHTDETKKLIGSKSVNRNWTSGSNSHNYIEVNKNIFIRILSNLELTYPIYEEISDKYFLETNVRIKMKKIRNLFKEYNLPFLCGKNKGKNKFKNKFKNYAKIQKITNLININRLNTIEM